MTPHDAATGLEEFDPNASGSQDQGVVEHQMGGLLADDLGQVSGPSHCFRHDGPPVRNIPVKIRRNPGLVVSPLYQIALDVVKVCHWPWYLKVHGEELTHQALYLLSDNATLRFRNGQKGEEFVEISLREGFFSRLHVNCPPYKFLDTGPVYLPRQDFFMLTKSLVYLGKYRESHLRA